MRYWARINKKTEGPFTLEELAKNEDVKGSTRVCPEGEQDASAWRRLSDVVDDERRLLEERKRETQERKEEEARRKALAGPQKRPEPPAPPSEGMSKPFLVFLTALLSIGLTLALERYIPDVGDASLKERAAKLEARESELDRREKALAKLEERLINSQRTTPPKPAPKPEPGKPQPKKPTEADRQRLEREIRVQWNRFLESSKKAQAATRKHHDKAAEGTVPADDPVHKEMVSAQEECKREQAAYRAVGYRYARWYGARAWSTFETANNLAKMVCSW